ncbi:transcriptional regulator LldR [Acinetobacter sp. MD2(2019)]|uniref:transcriptional regulator LldR n=1 Tax=Acinetobacter sp. MD2(2019) TaxID=2605273 RepID=UPI002D1F6F05|nr:transcriptional regulator LldR [Acinetobacter sp. MD2(2019)]MEB3754208.1 transcriptional regulator LldR [Acinetobacter sp. MD2(2019)]
MKIADQVIQQLSKLIEQQDMQVGDRLPSERKLCEQLTVSRASLREALQKMNNMGILVSKVGNGTYLEKLPDHWSEQFIIQPISSLIHEDPLYRFDVQEARLVLEGGTAWYAAQRATEEDRAKIHFYYDQVLHFQSSGDADKASEADANFHLAIAEASHNSVLIQMMRSLFNLLQYNVVLGRRKIYTDSHKFEQLHLQHSQVMDAIDRQDPETARASVCSHIEYIIEQVRGIDETEARMQRVSRLKRIDLK